MGDLPGLLASSLDSFYKAWSKASCGHVRWMAPLPPPLPLLPLCGAPTVPLGGPCAPFSLPSLLPPPLHAQLPAAPWGIISVKGQDEDYETPMQARGGLVRQERGGLGGVGLEKRCGWSWNPARFPCSPRASFALCLSCLSRHGPPG